jgi:hypothetical protein
MAGGPLAIWRFVSSEGVGGRGVEQWEEGMDLIVLGFAHGIVGDFSRDGRHGFRMVSVAVRGGFDMVFVWFWHIVDVVLGMFSGKV